MAWEKQKLMTMTRDGGRQGNDSDPKCFCQISFASLLASVTAANRM